MTSLVCQSTYTQTHHGADMARCHTEAWVYGDMSDSITWLEVPFHEKDLAKGLGARWDPRRIRWYAPANTNLENLRPWLRRRIYLQCTDEDRSVIEELGARWDRAIGSWYITDDMDSVPFNTWLPA
jgi:hypothetical protein|eukprot:7386416-Prymnesium_polylepis.2